ncbi:MAG: gamma-glutamyl-phosphate reductase, partial [Candidatus Nanopelagicaceae bacterium]
MLVVDAQALVNELADKARLAARTLSVATGTERASALLAIADEIEARAFEIQEANQSDMERGKRDGLNSQLLDRLMLNDARIKGIASGARQVAALEDPLGQTLRERTLANGLHLRQIS